MRRFSRASKSSKVVNPALDARTGEVTCPTRDGSGDVSIHHSTLEIIRNRRRPGGTAVTR